MSRPMVPVLLCGGSGTRLWPLSRTEHPKQLLPLVGDHSLFQDTLARLDGIDAATPVVVCSHEVRFAVVEQLREVGVPARVLVEPQGRNTAPAIGAAAHLAAIEGDPLLLVLPSDHHIADTSAFQASVRAAQPLAEAGHLVVFGVTPDHAETGFGWIQRGTPVPGGHRVASFVEKPDAVRARTLLAEGAAWNAGIFLFRASRFLDELERFAPRVAEACAAAAPAHARSGVQALDPAFVAAPAVSVDVAVMERTRDASVVPLDAGWSDVGSWTSLWASGVPDGQGNVTRGDTLLVQSAGSYVRAAHRLVVCVGVTDLVVVETPDAVLVADRTQVQRVREAVEALRLADRPEVRAPQVVAKPWGTYEVLAEGPSWKTKQLVIHPGGCLSLQRHQHRAEQWTIVSGTARVTVGTEVRDVAQGDTVSIPVGAIHRLEALGADAVHVVEVQLGAVREDDIERLDDAYGRTG